MLILKEEVEIFYPANLTPAWATKTRKDLGVCTHTWRRIIYICQVILPFSAVISLARTVLKRNAQLFQAICEKTVTTMAANEENWHFQMFRNPQPPVTAPQNGFNDGGTSTFVGAGPPAALNPGGSDVGFLKSLALQNQLLRPNRVIC